jgi:hypothetical protein
MWKNNNRYTWGKAVGRHCSNSEASFRIFMTSVVSCRWHDETEKQRKVEPTCFNTEVTWRNSTWPGNQLPGVQDTIGSRRSQLRIEGGGNAGTSTIVVKSLKFDRSTSWTVISLPVWACGWLQQLGSLWDGHTSTWNYAGTSFQHLTVFQLAWQWRYYWGTEGPLQRPPPGSGLLISTENQDSAAVYGERVVDKSKCSKNCSKTH